MASQEKKNACTLEAEMQKVGKKEMWQNSSCFCHRITISTTSNCEEPVLVFLQRCRLSSEMTLFISAACTWHLENPGLENKVFFLVCHVWYLGARKGSVWPEKVSLLSVRLMLSCSETRNRVWIIFISHLRDPVCHLARCICCDWRGIRPGQLGSVWLIPLTRSRHWFKH